jgi:hypothetical protein
MLVFVLQGIIRENNRLKKEKEQTLEEREKALENGVVCLLRVKLIEYHAKYMELGYITTHAYENWMLMYKAYKAMKGNSFIDEIYEVVVTWQIET